MNLIDGARIPFWDNYMALQRKPNQNITEGILLSQQTFLIYTDSNAGEAIGHDPISNILWQSYIRSPDAKLNEILFQIHPPNEFSKLMLEKNKAMSLSPFILKANREYFIDVTPTGQITSQEYKKLNFEDRNCYSDEEFLKSSLFKIYTKNNCKYECQVKKSIELCQCIPWDFMQGESM